ncbi:MAG: HDOD domain-containing protein [Phycisphaerales bacterium]|nr:HDOD domain-containing protein [Phycisphaerales bacterium]
MSALAELKQKFREAKLPTSPALAMQILELSRNPDASIAEFSDLIKTDPALCGRLLQAANSAEAAQVHPVTTIERAVALLGLRRVKSLSLGFQLVAHLDRLGGASFDMLRFWQHSLLRACIARALAEVHAKSVADEAFLLGMMQDCGIPLLIQVIGPAYANALHDDRLSPASLYDFELISFPYTHVDAAVAMFEEWGLPEELTKPIAEHHIRPTPEHLTTDADKLRAIGYLVGNLCFDASQLRCDSDEELPNFAEAVFGLDRNEWDRIQHRALVEYKQTAEIYGSRVGKEIDVVDLLSEANRHLSKVADETEVSLDDLKEEQERIIGTHQRVAKSLREYRERAALDPLTGLLNRGALAEMVRTLMDQGPQAPTQFCVVFLDIDNFKQINDQYGHQVGDKALTAAAGMLCRESDYGAIVARFGGEEFLLVYPGVTPDEAQAIGKRILERIRAVDVSSLGLPQRVTCSVGVAWTDLINTRAAEDMIAHADSLMYRAKRAGKNRLCFETYYAAQMPPEVAVPATPPESDAAGKAAQAPKSADSTLDELVAVAAKMLDTECQKIVGLRKEVRNSVFMPCRVEMLGQIDESWCYELGVIRDQSIGGAGIVMQRPLVRGESVQVVFGEGEQRRTLRAMVSFSRPVGPRFHHVGVQFTPTPISEQSANRLEDPAMVI